jgi:uncharacterized iron-regulated membrane protein
MCHRQITIIIIQYNILMMHYILFYIGMIFHPILIILALGGIYAASKKWFDDNLQING